MAKSTRGEDGPVFRPREYRGGRVRICGCSPGCLLVSLAVSILLTLAVNGCIRVLG